MKRMLIGIAVVFAVVVAVVVGLLASPIPTLWLMRHNFGGESHAKIPAEQELRASVEVTRDLAYESPYGRSEFDLYVPRGAEGPLPVVFWVHGGAFVAGSKDGVEPWGLSLAARGYAVVAPDYAWSGEVGYPDQGRQLQECLGYLERKAAVGELPLDMGRVVLAGDSAGAFLAAQAALVATNPEYAEVTGIKSALDPEAVRAALLFCGPYDIDTILKGVERLGKPSLSYVVDKLGWAFFGTRGWHDLPAVETTSIGAWTTGAYPPSFISDGNGFSFEQEGRDLAATLAERGVAVESLFFPRGEAEDDVVDHEYQMNLVSEEGALAWDRATAFLDVHCPAA